MGSEAWCSQLHPTHEQVRPRASVACSAGTVETRNRPELLAEGSVTADVCVTCRVLSLARGTQDMPVERRRKQTPESLSTGQTKG